MLTCVIVTDKGYKGLNPVIFGYEDCKPGHYYGPAVRNHWLIHFVVSGFGKYKIGNREYNLEPGEMFVIPPFEETFYQADTKKPWSYIWIGFTDDGSLPVTLQDKITCPSALGIFSDMKKCEQLSSGRSAFLAARLWDLFSCLAEGHSPQQEDVVKKALDCIHSEYMTGLDVSGLAHRLNLDRSYFSTLFKKRMGTSPKEYIMSYKMNMAASLLADRGMSVSVTAYSVGYNDIFTFSKMFKKFYGVTPSEYKKRTS
ncbi:MAG: AraC family transcriptional regulator [Clostridia bacterium]|nr:AraC family transcriptional regulator [Clostridia bacterium]